MKIKQRGPGWMEGRIEMNSGYLKKKNERMMMSIEISSRDIWPSSAKKNSFLLIVVRDR
jgi:hypothetical protein